MISGQPIEGRARTRAAIATPLRKPPRIISQPVIFERMGREAYVPGATAVKGIVTTSLMPRVYVVTDPAALEEAVLQALMRDRKLLTWKTRRPVKLASGKHLQVLNWDYKQMARTAVAAMLAVQTTPDDSISQEHTES